MKKVISFMLAVMMVFALTVSVTALSSPQPEKYYKMSAEAVGPGKADVTPVKVLVGPDGVGTEDVTFTATEDGGEFIRWEFQCEYDVVSGTVQNDVSYDKVVVLRPKSDIHGIAYFKANDEPSEKPTEAPKKPDDGKTSPKTGYPLLFVFGAMGLALVAGIAVTKKMKG